MTREALSQTDRLALWRHRRGGGRRGLGAAAGGRPDRLHGGGADRRRAPATPSGVVHGARLWPTRATPISPRCSSGSRRKRPPFAGIALDRPVLMGIVNVTPDSFSDGGLYDTTEERHRACRRAGRRRRGHRRCRRRVRRGRAPTRPRRGRSWPRVVPVIDGPRRAPRRDLDRYAQSLRWRARRPKPAPRSSTTCRRSPMIQQSLAGRGGDGVSRGPHACARASPRPCRTIRAMTTWCSKCSTISRRASRRPWRQASSAARIAADPGLGFGKTLAHNLALLAHTSPVPWPRRAASDRRLAQALHQGVAGGAEAQRAEPGLPSRGDRRGGARGADFAGA